MTVFLGIVAVVVTVGMLCVLGGLITLARELGRLKHENAAPARSESVAEANGVERREAEG